MPIVECLPSSKGIDAECKNATQEPADRATNRSSGNLSFGDQVQHDEDQRAKDGATDRNGLVAAVLFSSWGRWGLVVHSVQESVMCCLTSQLKRLLRRRVRQSHGKTALLLVVPEIPSQFPAGEGRGWTMEACFPVGHFQFHV